MKVWITAYALSKGIEFEPEAEDKGNGYIARPNSRYVYYSRQDWHDTREAAVIRAEEMRTRRLASLRKQIAKLEKADFSKDYIPAR